MLTKQQFTKQAANREAKDPKKNEYLISLRKLYETEAKSSNVSAIYDTSEKILAEQKMSAIHSMVGTGLLKIATDKMI